MKRRAFLALAGTAAIAGAVGLSLGPRRLARAAKRQYLEIFGPDDAEVAASLQRQLPHLTLAAGTAQQFVRDYRASRDADPLTVPVDPEVVKQFLLSTNFVLQKGDPSKPVSYVQLYSPYESACYNPYMFVERDEQGVVI